MLYSGDMNDKYVVAGTVFRVVLVWEIETGHLLKRLEGHTGVIFDVLIYNFTSVASVSDDRSVRLWPNALTQSDYSSDNNAVLYGHTARVWRVV